jgi:hypothetical protein
MDQGATGLCLYSLLPARSPTVTRIRAGFLALLCEANLAYAVDRADGVVSAGWRSRMTLARIIAARRSA